MIIIAILLYFLILLAIGIYAHKRTGKHPEDYFLANRNFGAIILFFTLAATNFSAFSFLGFAGKAYTDGLGQYGIMALGTSFMAIMFYFLGRKIWKLGKKKGYITPGELIGKEHGSKSLQILFALVMSIFTIPYLAIQAVGAGYILQMIFPNLSIKIGAIIVMTVICLYVLFGGMKASGWTDVFQGLLMILAMFLAFAFISNSLGGVKNATYNAMQVDSSLFSRPGPRNYFTIEIWVSFLLLWIFCDPMFPQIFSRFYTAKNEDSLKMAMILYPLLISFFFLFPVLIGVWAHGTGIEIDNPDNVLLLMVKNYTPSFIFSFVIVGALAALMSTADSQLLSLSTMLARDIFGKGIKQSKLITIFLTIFSIAFLIFGYDVKTGIMGILVKTTFSGLVVLAPSIIATLYWKRTTKWGCIASIVGGEAIVFLYALFPLPSFGFLPSMISFFFSSFLLFIFSLITSFY